MDYKIQSSDKFRYFEGGSGQPIVILHGLFGALSNFEGVIEHFSKNYRVIVPLMPLYDMPLVNTGVKSLSKYVRDFIKHLNLGKVILLGNSLGGHVALITTRENPELVKAMILTGSSGLYENAFGGSFPRREDKDYIRKKIAVTFYDPEIVTEELVEVTYNIVKDRNNLIKVLALAKSAIRHNMRNDLPAMNLPVCLIWGKNDSITPPEVAEEFKESLPDADLYWIDKCGHAAMMEHPQEFNKLMQQWLDERNMAKVG